MPLKEETKAKLADETGQFEIMIGYAFGNIHRINIGNFNENFQRFREPTEVTSYIRKQFRRLI